MGEASKVLPNPFPTSVRFSVVFDSKTPWTVDRQAPLSMEFSRQEILAWVAILFFRGSSRPRDHIQVSRIDGRFLTV